MRHVWCVPRAKLRDVMGRGRVAHEGAPPTSRRAAKRRSGSWACQTARTAARDETAGAELAQQRSELLRAPAARGTCAVCPCVIAHGFGTARSAVECDCGPGRV